MIPSQQRARRKKLVGPALLLAAGVLSTAGAVSWAQQAPGKKPDAKPVELSPEEGKKTFESICATCHALDGRGGERGPNIATRPDILRMPDGELFKIISNGKAAAGMPPFAYLGPAKVKAVLLHLRSLQGKEKITKLPGDAAQGARIFSGKGDCASCHMVDGRGGFLGSDLTGYAANLPVADIRTAIVEPNKNLAPRKGTVVLTTRDGKNFTGIARNEDNFSLQLQTLDGAFHFFKKADLEHLEFQPSSVMPADYGTKLSAAEIDDLISYLVNVARSKNAKQVVEKYEYDED